MGAVGTLLRVARRGRPVVAAIQRAESGALAGGEVAVLPGEPDATERLRELTGAPSAAPMPDAGLWLYAAVAGGEPGAVDDAARALAGHRREGGSALAILVGRRSERVGLESVFLSAGRPDPSARSPHPRPSADGRLEPSNLAQVASLQGAGARRALHAVAVALAQEDDATAAARRYHALRPAVAHLLIARAARRAGAIGAVNVLPGADLLTLALLQIQLLAELSAVYERPIGAERAAEAAAVAGAGFGWRALARVGASVLPAPAFAVRGGVAYATTRALGEAAVVRLESGGEVLGDRPTELLRTRVGGLAAKVGLGEGGTP